MSSKPPSRSWKEKRANADSWPARFLRESDTRRRTPVHVVWEVTLACDLHCIHCGSRAGHRRPSELTTEECLDVIRQLAALGTREVTLIGGEAYLRPDWTDLIRAIRDAGMLCTLQSGGRNLTESRISAAAKAGLSAAGISIDGPREVHDYLRGLTGSHDNAIRALRLLRTHGIPTSVNTQISSLVMPHLARLLEDFVELGVRNWQVQLTVAMGRAGDRPEILLQPYRVLELMPLLAELYRRGVSRGVLLQIGNNIGYFGPYESVLRNTGAEGLHWTGCFAGQTLLALEADGTVKGCPSLATSVFAGGSVRESSLERIWNEAANISMAGQRSRSELWGFCGSCYYAGVCRGGCTWTAHSLMGKPGNNPYCHHRALELARAGLRERITRTKAPPGTSFDFGEFEIVLETLEGRVIEKIRASQALVQIEPVAPPKRDSDLIPSVAAKAAPEFPHLDLCRGCSRHIFPQTAVCPHCGADVAKRATQYEQDFTAAVKASEKLRQLLDTVLEPQPRGRPNGLGQEPHLR